MSEGAADLLELGFEGIDRFTGSKHYDRLYRHTPQLRRRSQARRDGYGSHDHRDPRASHRSLDTDRYRSTPRQSAAYDPADYRHNPKANYAPRGFNPYEDEDDDYDDEEEDQLERQRKAFTRAYVETAAFNDPDEDSPATPSEAYGGSAYARRPGSRADAAAAHRRVSGGGLKPAAEYTPPPYPYARPAPAPSPPRRDLDLVEFDAADRRGSVRSAGSAARRHHYRPRSKSPRRKGVASSVAGALAGGFLGTEISKGDTLTTVATAVLGAISAREAGRQYDRRKEEKRGRRARYDYDYDHGYGYDYDYDYDHDYGRGRRSSR
ncbi:uncharacterized protein K452DRAFT_361367 [Aplosporella prunicola CBS 121167]|uniref:Glycine zipper 2TM domain-containing protein n=1 Tax=Aplosporella prunicola CBS 121167 TaxID=1176127 RepID=A0A6A6B4H2_9PEZI|nr:uncharacterized protein K452DRAFT_361367 [Aplosporella prunicola CBS 121167]KAF2138293.1 hypothetical protein K452DRAFT_361367 [Aplosporella prunicola CBS 121167]